ncbi:hypothetical protein D3C81_1708040 [compost metagenome]
MNIGQGRADRYLVRRVVSDFQTFNDLAADQMDVDDFIEVFIVDIGVPGALRIDHDDRAFFAAAEATGLIDADCATAAQAQFLDACLQVFLRGVRTTFGTALAAIIALIHANE